MKSGCLLLIIRDLPSKARPATRYLRVHPWVSSSTSNTTHLPLLLSHYGLLSSLLPKSMRPQALVKPHLFYENFSCYSSHEYAPDLLEKGRALSGIYIPLLVRGAYNFYFSLNCNFFQGGKTTFSSMPYSEHHGLQAGGLSKHLLVARSTHVFNLSGQRTAVRLGEHPARLQGR